MPTLIPPSRTPTVGLMMLDDRSYPMGMLERPRQFTGLHNIHLETRHVPGCTVERLVYEGDKSLRNDMITTARELVASGAEVIVGDCGFMLLHQEAVRDSVPIPVMLSVLGLVPLLLSTLAADRSLAIVTASGKSLTDDLLDHAGPFDRDRLVVGDMASKPIFNTAVMQCIAPLDHSVIETETVDVVVDLLEGRNDIGAVLLECTGLPPYAAAVQSRVGLPVYDVVQLVDLLVGALRPRRAQQLH